MIDYKHITLTNEDVLILKKIVHNKGTRQILTDAEYNLLRELEAAAERIILNRT